MAQSHAELSPCFSPMWKSLKYKSKREVQRQLQKSYFQMRAEGLSALRIIFSISLLVTVQKC